MKTPKFMICTNPVADDPEEYIYHSHKPRFLSIVRTISFEEIEQRPQKPFADMLYINAEGEMEVYRIELTDNIEKADEEDCLDELFGAADFFCSYIQMIEKEENMKPGYPVKDFSPELPGLKILQSPGSWTIVYNGLVAEFETEEEMDDFLETELNIEPELLDQGVVNRFE